MLRKREWQKNIAHGDGIGKKILHITIPEKKFPSSGKSPPPPPSKVKWSAPHINTALSQSAFRIYKCYIINIYKESLYIFYRNAVV